MQALDPHRQILPDTALVCGAADGRLRLWGMRDMAMLLEVRACDGAADGIQHVCTEPSSTLVVSGDSAGRVKVWDAPRS